MPKNVITHNHRGKKGENFVLLHSDTIRIAAEFSFGKTVLCVALVCKSPVPEAYPMQLNHMVNVQGNVQRNVLKTNKNNGKHENLYYYSQVTVKYSRLYAATLVIAEASVITQWVDCIKTFAPSKKYFVVDSVRPLRKFAEMFENGEASEFDLVLLKGGKVSGKFVVGAEEPRTTRPMTEAMVSITAGYAWARVIVDDFDTIRLSSADIMPPALSRIIVSATDRRSSVKQYMNPGATVEEFLQRNIHTPILGYSWDPVFDGPLKLICDPQYVRESIGTTAAQFRRIVVKGGHAVGMLKDLGVPADIVEMIASGAIETAAEKLNIKIDSVGDLLKRVLDKQTHGYRTAVKILDRVRNAREATIKSVLAPNSETEVKKIRKVLKGGTDAEAEKALGRLGPPSKYLTAKLKTLEEYADKLREKTGARIERMRSNVRENQCQACTVEIDDESYIVNCCQIVICGYCCIVDGVYIKRCPNCAKDVAAKTDLIYVGKELNLQKVLDDKVLLAPGETKPAPATEEKPPVADKFSKWKDDARLTALLQLVTGAKVDAIKDEKVPPFVTGLINGRKVVPRPEKTPEKILVFAAYSEASRKIVAALAELKVPVQRLQGGRTHKDEVVRAFKTSPATCVLVANTSKDCAGLHIPETSTVVLYHHHAVEEVARQAVGRGQRVGRDYSLEVVEILNEGEARDL